MLRPALSVESLHTQSTTDRCMLNLPNGQGLTTTTLRSQHVELVEAVCVICQLASNLQLRLRTLGHDANPVGLLAHMLLQEASHKRLKVLARSEAIDNDTEKLEAKNTRITC